MIGSWLGSKGGYVLYFQGDNPPEIEGVQWERLIDERIAALRRALDKAHEALEAWEKTQVWPLSPEHRLELLETEHEARRLTEEARRARSEHG